MSNNQFQNFWKNIDDPLHRSDSEAHYQNYAAELNLLLKDAQKSRVLELGCGNGAFYTHLGFDGADRYVGVDFSPAMLKKFSEDHPDVELHEHDGSTFLVDEKFDLIYSNGMIQNFDAAMMDSHFANAQAMLAPGGMLVCASYPWVSARDGYYAGDAGAIPSKPPSWINAKLSVFRRSRRIMGHWYSTYELTQLAERHGFMIDVYGSLHYRYRNHAVLRTG